MCSVSPSFPVKMFLNWTEYCQDHQAETHEEQQDEVSEEQVWRETAGATLSVLQVLVHTVHQAVGPGAVTQLSAGFVDLERVTHSYAPHLHGRRTQWISVRKLLKVTPSGKHRVTLWYNQWLMVAYGYCIFLLVRDKMSACDAHTVSCNLAQVKILFSYSSVLFWQNYFERLRQMCLSWLECNWGHFL